MNFSSDFYGIAAPILAQVFAVIGLIYIHSIGKKEKPVFTGELRKISARFSSKKMMGVGAYEKS